MIGIEHTFRVHADTNGEVVFDSFIRKEFSHDETRTEVKTSVSVDHGLQAFVVQISYPEGKEPALAEQTVSALFHDALDAIESAIKVGTARGKAPKSLSKIEKAAVIEAKVEANVSAKAKPVVEAVKEEVKEAAVVVEAVATEVKAVETKPEVEVK